MGDILDTLFENALKNVQSKRKLSESKEVSKQALTEATMNDIPHEIDDTVHALASERVRLEDLRKTWEAAGFKDLTALDDIIKGLVDLTTLVYTKGAYLADQKIGTLAMKVPAEAPAQPEGPVPMVEPVIITQKEESSTLVEEPSNEFNAEEFIKDSNDKVAEKEITLAECEAMCALPANVALKKAFKKCVSDFRHSKPSCSNGELVKIVLTPLNNLRLHFDGVEKPAFAYSDGDYLI